MSTSGNAFWEKPTSSMSIRRSAMTRTRVIDGLASGDVSLNAVHAAGLFTGSDHRDAVVCAKPTTLTVGLVPVAPGEKRTKAFTIACGAEKASRNAEHEPLTYRAPTGRPGRRDGSAHVAVGDDHVTAVGIDLARVVVDADRGADPLVLEVEDRRPGRRRARRRRRERRQHAAPGRPRASSALRGLARAGLQAARLALAEPARRDRPAVVLADRAVAVLALAGAAERDPDLDAAAGADRAADAAADLQRPPAASPSG